MSALIPTVITRQLLLPFKLVCCTDLGVLLHKAQAVAGKDERARVIMVVAP